MTSISFWTGCLALLAALAWPLRACAEQRHYLAVLSSPSRHDTHTFAVLVKTTVDGAREQVETKAIRMGSKTAESLTEVLERAQHVGARCTMWGPYPIQKELYDGLVEQTLGYRIGLAETANKSDAFASLTACLRAVARAGEATGEAGKAPDSNRLLVLRGLEPWLLPPGQSPDWLRERLELRKYGVYLPEAGER